MILTALQNGRACPIKVSDFHVNPLVCDIKKIQLWKVRKQRYFYISSPVFVNSIRVTKLSWLYPICVYLILSQGCDNVLCVWNVGTGELVYKLSDAHPDLIYSVSWNMDGSAICTVCKDKALRIIDPRRRSVLKVTSLLLWSALLRPTSNKKGFLCSMFCLR